jgi:NAD+ synthase
MGKEAFHKDILKIRNVERLVGQITARIREDVTERLHRMGGVVGISGGIDSSVTLALAARALGPGKVLGIMMPEKDSSPDSRILATGLAEQFGVPTELEDITGALEGFGCYARRDEAVRQVYPDYDPAVHKMKIGIRQDSRRSGLPPVFHLTVVLPDGSEVVERLPSGAMRTIIAASNFKQRSRMSLLYYHAEKLHYAVIGTPNKHEVDQGFFVKHGDGGADLFPIGNLYKCQVYQLAAFLDIPQGIIERTPTTDTYSAEQTQEEFFYQYPFEQLDLLWYGFENGYSPSEVAGVMGMDEEEVALSFKNLARKKETTEYLRMGVIKDYAFI